MANKYGCEICGDEDFFGESIRFAGARTAKACNQCVNDWNRKVYGADDALTNAYREFARSQANVVVNVNPHDTDAPAKAQVITNDLESWAFAATKALGELWDEWAQKRYTAKPE